MILYEFMNKDLFKAGKDISKYMKTKYGLTLPDKLFNDENIHFLYDYLLEKVKEHNLEKINIDRDKFLFEDEIEERQIDRVIKKVSKIVLEPKNYLADLYSALYIGILFNMQGEDSFACIDNEPKRKDEDEEQYQLRKNENNMKISQKDEMNSVWTTSDDKINRNIVREKYPVPIKMAVSEADEKDTIVSIPGGCFDYHKTMISRRNIGIFETTKEKGSFQRYSFMKNHEIYTDLSGSSIENLLFMEYTLGIGYTNQIFGYLKNLKTYSEIQAFSSLILAGAEINHFFLRKMIINVIWDYIKVDLFNDRYHHNAEILINVVNKIIATIMKQVLEVWWYSYLEKGTTKELHMLKLQAESYWKNYFDEEIAYQEWMKICKTQDWRGIEKVEDIFAWVEGLPYTENDLFLKKMEHLSTTVTLKLIDINDNKRYLVIEKPIHKIGEIILAKTVERLKYIRFPESLEQLYIIFNNIKREEFNKFKKEEKARFSNVNITISPDLKKVKGNHIYAFINHQVIDKCLEKVKDSV